MAHFNFVISQNAKWGHAGFYIDCHRMTVPENISLQKALVFSVVKITYVCVELRCVYYAVRVECGKRHKTDVSVCLFVPSIDSISGGRRVCC